MTVERLGETAFILRDLPIASHLAAYWIEQNIPYCEAVASYETVGLYFQDQPPNAEQFLDRIGSFDAAMPASPRIHSIPVCYELGEDMIEASSQLGLSPAELARIHSSVSYECFAVGFCPGFPYLGYLDTAISGIPRLASPRVKVPKGAVAIAGRQTGVYPSETPGGWRLIGRTPLEIASLTDEYFPIRPGDRIAFEPISVETFQDLGGKRL